MSDLHFVEALPWHCLALAERLRQADKDEIEAAGEHSPREALEVSLQRSRVAWTVMRGDLPEMMFGAGDLNVLTATGAPWLLASDAVERHPKWFLLQSLRWRGQLLSRYAVLRNLIDDRNTTAIAWLRWLGFTFSDPVPWGPRNLPFRLFELRRDDVMRLRRGDV